MIEISTTIEKWSLPDERGFRHGNGLPFDLFMFIDDPENENEIWEQLCTVGF